MSRTSIALAALMTLMTTGALPAQQEPAGAAGRWEWVAVRETPGRRFRVFVPTTAPEAGGALVVMLHGCLQDPDDFARGSRFNRAAAEHGVVVAYPEQPAAENPQKCWNWFLPQHQGRDAGEPALIAAIARQVAAARAIDPARVFVGGISAGGAMAQNAAASYPDVFAAVGVHSGVPYAAAEGMPAALAAMRGDPLPLPVLVAAALRQSVLQRPPAVFAIHGEADAVVSPKNLAALFVQWSGAQGAGAARDDTVQLGGRAAVRTRHVLSDGAVPVEVWRVPGLGHAWSGGSRAGTFTDPAGPDASGMMLEFFLAHGRQ